MIETQRPRLTELTNKLVTEQTHELINSHNKKIGRVEDHREGELYFPRKRFEILKDLH